MKNPTNNDAYDVLFRSYELANKQIKEIQAQLALEQERNLNNVANADLQLAELQAEPVYVCEECDNERLIELKEELAAAQAETQAMVGRLDKLAEEWQVDITWSEQVDGTFKHCADRLREAISGENKQQVGLLEIADDVIAEREAADQKWADMRYGGEGEK